MKSHKIEHCPYVVLFWNAIPTILEELRTSSVMKLYHSIFSRFANTHTHTHTHAHIRI